MRWVINKSDVFLKPAWVGRLLGLGSSRLVSIFLKSFLVSELKISYWLAWLREMWLYKVGLTWSTFAWKLSKASSLTFRSSYNMNTFNIMHETINTACWGVHQDQANFNPSLGRAAPLSLPSLRIWSLLILILHIPIIPIYCLILLFLIFNLFSIFLELQSRKILSNFRFIWICSKLARHDPDSGRFYFSWIDGSANDEPQRLNPEIGSNLHF